MSAWRRGERCTRGLLGHLAEELQRSNLLGRRQLVLGGHGHIVTDGQSTKALEHAIDVRLWYRRFARHRILDRSVFNTPRQNPTGHPRQGTGGGVDMAASAAAKSLHARPYHQEQHFQLRALLQLRQDVDLQGR